MEENIFFEIAIIIIVSSVTAWLSLYIKQPIIVGYILAGVMLGPWGLKAIPDIHFIDQTSHIGVTLLLFLAGLALEPHRIIKLFRNSLLLTVISSGLFAAITGLSALIFNFSLLESAIIGTAFMFSSTILVIKLLPTTTLHQKHMGAISIAVLILQDIIAVMVLLFIKGGETHTVLGWVKIFIAGFILTVSAILFEKYFFRKVMKKMEHFQEVLYLFTLAWCFIYAIAADQFGLSHEIGAFIAGVALASNPLALYLLEGLRFFRDFFLVLFFFSLGARLDLGIIQSILVPAFFISAVILLSKPAVYYIGFRLMQEKQKFSFEMSSRLGQASEFSLIIGFFAFTASIIGEKSFQLIQLTTIITMIISSYIVVLLFPTPLSTNIKLKQD